MVAIRNRKMQQTMCTLTGIAYRQALSGVQRPHCTPVIPRLPRERHPIAIYDTGVTFHSNVACSSAYRSSIRPQIRRVDGDLGTLHCTCSSNHLQRAKKRDDRPIILRCLSSLGQSNLSHSLQRPIQMDVIPVLATTYRSPTHHMFHQTKTSS